MKKITLLVIAAIIAICSQAQTKALWQKDVDKLIASNQKLLNGTDPVKKKPSYTVVKQSDGNYYEIKNSEVFEQMPFSYGVGGKLYPVYHDLNDRYYIQLESKKTGKVYKRYVKLK